MFSIHLEFNINELFLLHFKDSIQKAYLK